MAFSEFDHPEIVSQELELYVPGPVLYLTEDPDIIRKQIDGQAVTDIANSGLLDWISTDAIIPARDCRDYTGNENLGLSLLTGISNGSIGPGDIAGKFAAIVAGESFGRGSSREHVQLALQQAGVSFVFASSFERIFQENCANYGIYCLTSDKATAKQLLNGEAVPQSTVLHQLPPLTQAVIKHGGLISYLQARREGKVNLPEIKTQPRPMTMAEKIIARHAVQDNTTGVEYVKPGDQCFVRIETGYSYEVQSIISKTVLEDQYGKTIPVFPGPQFVFFEDHSALQTTNTSSIKQRALQQELVQITDSTLYPIEEGKGVEGICHTVMVEDYVLPGQIICGNDSHTDSVGVGNALAIGKGATDLAGAMLTGDILVSVPETIRFNFYYELPPGTTSKDLMLHILSMPQLRDTLIGSKRIFEYGGPGLGTLQFDDQFVLTNMAIEGQAAMAIVEPNEQVINFYSNERNLSTKQIEQMLVYSDPDAEYAAIFDIDLGQIEQMVALPGDPQRGIPLQKLKIDVPIDIAYIGSCTGGKLKDLKEVADTLRGKKVAANVKMYVQASSQKILRRATELGYIQDIVDAGATFLPPGCGACMDAGPGSSIIGETTISDTNRNFKGRMGGGDTYLASPSIVAQSALHGMLSSTFSDQE